MRIDLGAYAMAVPRFIHGNKSFDQSFDGFGVKLQYFLFADRAGASSASTAASPGSRCGWWEPTCPRGPTNPGLV